MEYASLVAGDGDVVVGKTSFTFLNDVSIPHLLPYSFGIIPTSLLASPSTAYTYDANGNMITRSGGWTYKYDYENRMVKVTHSGTTVQTNSYDGNGNRVKQVAGSSTFTYSYQGLNILYEKNVTGSTTTVTVLLLCRRGAGGEDGRVDDVLPP